MELIILEGYGNIEWTILPTPKDKNKYQYKYPNKKILFVKLTERSEDDEFIKYSYYFLLGDMKVWLQSGTMLEPTLHQQQQHLNNNTASSIIQISDGPNTKVSIEFSSLLEFSNWFDEIRKTIALLIINHTLHNIQSIQVVQTPLLFQCLKRCYELIYDHELDLVRIRNLLAVKQQILYCVNGWRAKTVSSDAILFTIQKFMCHILLAHFEPLILDDPDFQALMLIARELLSSCEFHRFETLSTGVRTARYKRLSDAPHSDHSPTHTTVANISESVSTTAIDVKLSSDPTSTLSTCATESFYLSTYIIPQATKVHRNALQPKAIGSTVLTPVRHKPSKLSTTITNKENQNSHSNLQMKSTDIKGTTKETNHQPSTTSTSTSTDRVTSNSPNRGLQTQVVKSCDSAIVNIHVPWVESPYSVVCTRRVCNETPVTEESDLKHNLLSMTYDGGETETVDYTSEQKESDKVIESPYHSNISSSRIFYDKTSDLSDQRCADIWNVQLQSPDENSSVFSKANANLHEDREFVIHKLEKNKKKSNTFVSPASDDSLEYKFYGNQRVVVSRKSF